jgi:ribosomal protein L11 methyltransferase
MWKQLSLDVPEALKDAAIGELSAHGAAGVWESIEPAPGESRLIAYFDAAIDIESVKREITALFERAQCTAPTISAEAVTDQDWTEEWRKSYSSFPIGDEFFVIPSWCEDRCDADRLPIHIDPGQAFGTGTHETTQLTMVALERWVEPHHVVFDLGTGSGILAIASRMLGARRVFACDIDPVAVQVAKENVERNSEPDICTFCGSVDSVRTESVDFLLCNLTEDLIVELFPELDRALQPRGLAVFSGILNEQREDVLETMTRFGYVMHEEMMRGEWVTIVAEKPPIHVA